jgi:hypothetical protein
VRELPTCHFFRPDLLCPDDAALLPVGCKHVDIQLPPELPEAETLDGHNRVGENQQLQA